jgi:hypothetical protein
MGGRRFSLVIAFSIQLPYQILHTALSLSSVISFEIGYHSDVLRVRLVMEEHAAMMTTCTDMVQRSKPELSLHRNVSILAAKSQYSMTGRICGGHSSAWYALLDSVDMPDGRTSTAIQMAGHLCDDLTQSYALLYSLL